MIDIVLNRGSPASRGKKNIFLERVILPIMLSFVFQSTLSSPAPASIYLFWPYLNLGNMIMYTSRLNLQTHQQRIAKIERYHHY